MIVVCLRSGMGNQLYQYAFGRYLSIAANTDFALNDWFYNPHNKENPGRHFELLQFNCLFEKVFHENWKQCCAMQHNGISITNFISENKISMRQLINDAQAGNLDSCALVGFWQSDTSYLEDSSFRMLLINELTSRHLIKKKLYNHYLNQIHDAGNCVAVHVRRGDYLKFNFRFNTISKDYYDAALAKIRKLTGEIRVFVFSDDIDLVRSENIFDKDAIFVNTRSSFMDFNLMRSCKHNIIANCTFSWWSAYLNDHPDKIVVTPRVFFSDPDKQKIHEANPGSFPGWHKP